MEYLSKASEGDVVTEYHLEAAIGACHAMAESFENTDWKEIHRLYEFLSKIKKDPVVEMNKAIALGHAVSPQAALNALLNIDGLEQTHLYHAALGDFYRQIKDFKNSVLAYDKAIGLTISKQEKELLEKKKMSLT